jgi:hypothetical protein
MTRPGGVNPMSRGCRCGLPLEPPDGPHWFPSRDPDPGSIVAAVALCGRDPTILRSERVPGGWRSQGAAATYPEHSPPMLWQAVGRCWNGREHPVCEVTSSGLLQHSGDGGPR